MYALSVLFRRHTIIYNLFHPWHSVTIKPGININVLDETCETRLLYLGDSLFGELHQINVSTPPNVIDLGDIQCARIIHCDNTVPKMFIEHAPSTDFNQYNMEVPVNLQMFVSPMDTTVFLNKTPRLFDPDYNLEQKVDPTYIITSANMSVLIGEYTSVKTEGEIKTKPLDNIRDILSQHSPECQLRMQIGNIVSLRNTSRTPTQIDGFSTESTIVCSVKTPPAHALDSTTSTVHPNEDTDAQTSGYIIGSKVITDSTLPSHDATWSSQTKDNMLDVTGCS